MSELPQVYVTVVETHEDGTSIEIPFENVASDDPHVRSRRQSRRNGVISEIITEFSAAAERPSTYPAALPFVAGRAVWTNESPDGSTSIGARWLCDDPDAVLAAAISASRADGWMPADKTPDWIAGDAPVAVLQRDNLIRVFQKSDEGGTRVAHLTELTEL